MATAYCYRSGEILIGSSCPKEGLKLARARKSLLERTVSAVARHAYDGVTLLVPGIPEADTDAEALEAAIRFRREIERRIAPRGKRQGRFL